VNSEEGEVAKEKRRKRKMNDNPLMIKSQKLASSKNNGIIDV